MLNRAYNITSNYFNFDKEINELIVYFTKNFYPKPVFFRILKNFLFDKYTSKALNYDVPKQIRYIKLPYYGKMSFNCRNRLNKLLNNAFPSIDFRFIFTNDFKISNFFRIKDKIPDKVCSNICYKFTCPGCNTRYVGCSTRAFHIRIMEHTGKSYRNGQTLQFSPWWSWCQGSCCGC